MNEHTDVFMLKNQFIGLMDQDVFTIIVKGKQYVCNIYGVKSSDIIRELLEKNPNLRQYNYNIDDPTDDFQLICDFFNNQKIQITNKNMISLRNIAEGLKINPLLTYINKYIDSYENIDQITNPIKDLFDLLYHIKERTVNSVKEKILESIWIHSESNIKELAAFIFQVVRSGFRLQPYLIDLIISLDESKNKTNDLHLLKPFIVKQLLLFFYKSRFYCSFLYKLSKCGIIPIDQIIDQICEIDGTINTNKKKNNDRIIYGCAYHTNIVVWFYAELIEKNIINPNKLSNSIDSVTLSFLKSIDIQKYKELRDSCEPSNSIIKSIINDDVDTLQSIIIKSNIKIEEFKAPFNLFELFDQSQSKSLLNYSAEYGAIKCFKYLLLNQAKTDKFTTGFAFYGGNTEIIRTIDQIRKNNSYSTDLREQKYFLFDDKNLLSPIKLSIMMHQYNLFDWIIDEKEKYGSNSILVDFAITSVSSGNVHSFIRLVDLGLSFKNSKSELNDLIKIAADFGYYQLTNLMLCLYNDCVSSNAYLKNDSPVIFGNFSISKLFFNQETIILNYEHLLLVAHINEYLDISQYIIDNNLYQPMNAKSIVEVYKKSINEQSAIFNVIENKYKLNEIYLKFNIESKSFMEMLFICCTKKNYETFCKVFEFIEKTFSIVDFTEQFLEAYYSGSDKICQYLIDKKIVINGSRILSDYQKIFETNWKSGIQLFDIVDSNMKSALSRLFFDEAFKHKNKEAIKLLIPYNYDNRQLLLKAVEFNDIELVNIALDHNSKPEFVNQVFSEGTAITTSVKNNNIEILKRLLLVPGIDLNLRALHGFTPLVYAINKLNVEAMNLILDYYGDEIHSQIWQLELSLICIRKYTQKKSKLNSREDDLIYIINRLAKIDKNLSINYHDFIYNACKNNLSKLVDNLVSKVEDINVNSQDAKSGNTPLIAALKNKNLEIIKILLSFPRTDVNISNNNNLTPLIIAVMNENESVVSLIIKHPKFDPLLSNINYAFYIASDKHSILDLLYSHKDSIDINYQYDFSVEEGSENQDILISTTLTKAIEGRQEKKIQMIVSHPQFDPIRSNIISAILTTIEYSDSHTFSMLIKFVDDINAVSYDGKSLIDALLSNISMLSMTLSNQKYTIDDDKLLSCFNSVLSSKDCSIKVLERLFKYDQEHNKCIDFKNDMNSFYTIINTLNPDVESFVDFLLNHDADPNKPDKFGVYPLQYAIESNSLIYVKALIESKKIDYSIRLNRDFGLILKNETYLHLAARCDDSKILELLLKLNVIDVNSTDDLNECPIKKAKNAKQTKNYSILEYFTNYKTLPDKNKAVINKKKNKKQIKRPIKGLKGTNRRRIPTDYDYDYDDDDEEEEEIKPIKNKRPNKRPIKCVKQPSKRKIPNDDDEEEEEEEEEAFDYDLF